jgi:hypothetical protein
MAALALPAAAWAGADVAALQVALRIHGAHRGAVDGILGPETRAAVRRFQRAHGLAPVRARVADRGSGMFPRHAEWLFRQVRVGTPVFIVAA